MTLSVHQSIRLRQDRPNVVVLPTPEAQSLLSADWKPWQLKIGVAWQQTTAAIIETGRLILAAQDALTVSAFDVLVEQLPFTVRMAQRLMSTAANDVLSDATHVSR